MFDIKIKGSQKRRIDMVIRQISSRLTVRITTDGKQFLRIVIKNNQEFVKLHSFPLFERMLELFRMDSCCRMHVSLPSRSDLSLSGTVSEGECQELDETPYQQQIGARNSKKVSQRPVSRIYWPSNWSTR